MFVVVVVYGPRLVRLIGLLAYFKIKRKKERKKEKETNLVCDVAPRSAFMRFTWITFRKNFNFENGNPSEMTIFGGWSNISNHIPMTINKWHVNVTLVVRQKSGFGAVCLSMGMMKFRPSTAVQAVASRNRRHCRRVQTKRFIYRKAISNGFY